MCIILITLDFWDFGNVPDLGQKEKIMSKLLNEQQSRNYWAKVDTSAGPDGCWPWTAGTRRGYGAFRLDGRNVGAHQVAAALGAGLTEVLRGHGQEAAHKCMNKLCCNPAHVRYLSVAEHHAESVMNGEKATGDANGARTHPESRPRGDAHYSRTKPECLARGDAHGSRTKPECLNPSRGIANGKATTGTEAAQGAVRRILLGESTIAIEAELLEQHPVTIRDWVSGKSRKAEVLDAVLANL